MKKTSANSIVDDLFIEQMQDIYSEEKELATVLAKLEATATTPNLKKMFNAHLEQAKLHLQKMERVFSVLAGETSPSLQARI